MDAWYRIPLGDWVDVVVTWLLATFRGLFRTLSSWIGGYVDFVEYLLTSVPLWLLISIVVLLAYRIVGRGVGLFALLGLLLVSSLGLWDLAMSTLALVFTATFVSMLIGVPLGILSARFRTVDAILRPILDIMQTMPSFVYLIPALMFFGIGQVPGVVATVVFSMPPSIRLTNLGIRQVPSHLVDAARSFGATPGQTLFGVLLPLALPTIMAGVNQTIMLSLSMVVVAAMIGAGGLGSVVLTAIQRVQIGTGFEGGIAIVVFAIILDRTTQALAKMRKPEERGRSGVWAAVIGSLVALALLFAWLGGDRAPMGQTVRIAMPPWTTSPPTTYIAKLLLEEVGLNVEIDQTDAGVAYQALAAGDIDLLVDSWMPNLHANYFETYGERIEILGEPIYTGAEVGWGVPAYVPANSVEELNRYVREFGGQVIGIEPGAGMMQVSEQIIDAYNLNYELIAGSEFALLTTINEAFANEEWLVFLAWRPHFMFIQHDIKFLEEPRGIWTQDDVVKAARRGFAEEFPEAAALLGAWNMPIADVDWMMHEIEVKGRPAEEVAREWVNANRDLVDMWLGDNDV